MKRLFTILLSLMTLFATLLVISCNSDSSSSENDGFTQSPDEGDVPGSEDKGNSTIILHAQYPYIYVWDSGVNELDKKQNEMTAEDDGWYRFEIKASSAKVIFKPNEGSDWDGQTEDLEATSGEWWYDGTELVNTKPSKEQPDGSTLSAPTELKATASGNKIYLSWNAVDFAESYSIYANSKGPYSENAFFVMEADVPYANLTANIFGTNYFWVKAKNSSTESELSNIASCVTEKPSAGENTEPESISAPTGLKATAQSESEIRLNWNTVIGAASYTIYYGTSGNSSSATRYKNTTSSYCAVSGLEANTTYYFWVSSVTADYTASEFSNSATARTYANSSSGGSGSSGDIGGDPTVTNDFLSDVMKIDIFTKPGIKYPTLTDNKKGFYITLSNSGDMNANYYILYRSTTSKTDLSAYKKIKTVSKSSNIAFEDFDVSFNKNDTYYYIVIAVDSKNATIGTMSANGMQVVLGDTKVKYCTNADLTKGNTNRYVAVDGSDTVDIISYYKNGANTCTKSLEPGIHSIAWSRTLNGTYMNIVSSYNFLAGCEYSITFETSKMSSSSPTLSTSSRTGFEPPSY